MTTSWVSGELFKSGIGGSCSGVSFKSLSDVAEVVAGFEAPPFLSDVAEVVAGVEAPPFLDFEVLGCGEAATGADAGFWDEVCSFGVGAGVEFCFLCSQIQGFIRIFIFRICLSNEEGR